MQKRRCPKGHYMHWITIQNEIKGPRKEWYCQECWFEALRDAATKAAKSTTDGKALRQLQSAYQAAKKRRAKRTSATAKW